MKKEIIKSPTIEQLKEYLNRIKWDLRNVGCGYYRIINHKGGNTMFEIHKDSDELKDGVCGNPFGNNYCGTFLLRLSAIKLTCFGYDDFISISLINVKNNDFFILFYNHDLKEN